MSFPIKKPEPIHPSSLHPICLKPEFFPDVINKMANGASVIKLCREYGIEYSDLLRYVHFDPIRDKEFTLATKAGESWFIERLSDELKSIGLVDINDAFNPDGSVRPIEEIPEMVRRTIASIEVAEIWEEGERGKGKVQVGVLKKIKFHDKLKSIEMMGKKLKMFIDEVHVSVSGTVNHHVEKYDLEERIQMIRKNKALPLAVEQALPRETVEEAMIINKPGEDI